MRALWLALPLVACGSGSSTLGDTDDTDDTEVADTDPDTDPDPDTDTDTDTEPPAPVLRFVALGDAGEGNDEQYAVADVMESVCASRGCEFALLLGDNIYPSGAEDYDDTEFERVFELPYADIDLPFYVVLGNHDLGGDGLGIDLDFNKADYQVEYTDSSEKWVMPARYYAIPETEIPRDVAQLFALNTTDVFFGVSDVQQGWLDANLATATAPWRIAFGHHPYVSNGKHGNAGEYEGIGDWIPFTEIPRGQYVKDFMEESVCGEVDVYLSGHDHNRQLLYPPDGCDTLFIVSGAGAKTTDWREEDDNAVAWQDDAEEGFFWIEIQGDTLTAYAYDADGDEHGPFTYQKP